MHETNPAGNRANPGMRNLLRGLQNRRDLQKDPLRESRAVDIRDHAGNRANQQRGRTNPSGLCGMAENELWDPIREGQPVCGTHHDGLRILQTAGT